MRASSPTIHTLTLRVHTRGERYNSRDRIRAFRRALAVRGSFLVGGVAMIAKNDESAEVDFIYSFLFVDKLTFCIS